jgi:hypothetical protein
MTQEATDILETISCYCDSASASSETSFIQSSEEDFGETSEDGEFVVSDGEHSAYAEGSSVSNNSPFEDPDSEHENAAAVCRAGGPISCISEDDLTYIIGWA